MLLDVNGYSPTRGGQMDLSNDTKQRIMAKGFSQAYLIDYDETFAPIVKWVSICILLALAARLDLEVHQMDVKTTFLNGDLEHVIYMEPPLGCTDFGSSEIIWKLEKSL